MPNARWTFGDFPALHQSIAKNPSLSKRNEYRTVTVRQRPTLLIFSAYIKRIMSFRYPIHMMVSISTTLCIYGGVQRDSMLSVTKVSFKGPFKGKTNN